ncbi:MAG TPA: hypothetical protein VHD33_01260 [Legionellaceae bacterium]|nr:hypothetical protein [Legionellaceae bacterium]
MKLIKGLLTGCLLSFCSISQANCPIALPTHAAGFCESFRVAAHCRCYERTYSTSPTCATMDSIYKFMTAALGPLQRVCSTQRDTSVQECIDDWNCYRHGGVNSAGQLCSGTGHACI